MELDALTEPLDEAMAVVRHLESVATYPELREVFNAAQPEVSAFYSGIPLHAGLWQAIRSYSSTDEARALAGTRRRFLTKTLDTFRRHGADLDPAGKARLEAIDIELATITTKFSQNVLDSTNAFELVIADDAGLAGLPPSAVAAARASAAQKDLLGWRFTLQAPSYTPVMMYLDDAAIRQKMYRAYSTRASQGEHDNSQLLSRILELRRTKAELLGFRNFADLVLHDRMAHTGDRAEEFLKDLKGKTEAQFARHRGPGRAGAAALGRRLLRRKAARGALRFRPRATASLFPARTRGGWIIRNGPSPIWHSRGRRARRSLVGPTGALLRRAR
jgi:oligopeptidase A